VLEQIEGRLLDPDSHVMFLPSVYVDVLGEEFGGGLARWARRWLGDETEDAVRERRADARDALWTTKDWLALGADDASERVEALDAMGVVRQLVFPPAPMPCLHDTRAGARVARDRWNDFMLDWAAADPVRVRPVAQLALDDVDDAIDEAARLVERGARAIEVPFARPPAGRSPAAREWDRLWALLAEADVPVVIHIGGGGFGGTMRPEASFIDPAWGDGDTARRAPRDPNLDPTEVGTLGAFGAFDLATLHVGAEVFLSALVLGGVLTRHPRLRVGVIELGAHWVSSWVERLDWAYAMHRRPFVRAASLPSAAIRRQVRVTASYGEPVGRYIERDELTDVYMFATDYPHVEGGTDPIGTFHRSVESLDVDIVERTFVTNAELLLPA